MRPPPAFRKTSVVLSILLLTTSLFAQSTGGRIVGHVTDPTGADISGAKVTLTNDETGVTRTVESNATGEYNVLQLPVGTYSVTIERTGFKKNVRKAVRLELNQVLTLDAVLQVGSREESVDVTGSAPLVDTTSTQLGAVVDERSVVKLPLNARDTYQLLQLQPGVQGVGGSDLFYGSNQSGAVSVNGGRGRSNNFSVNGGDGNDLFVNSPAIQPTPDSIQEFRVLSNTFDAEYGRNSGAVINVVTKSGTNDWHGSVYEFLRNQIFNAKGFLDLRRPDDKQNQFGGTFGGPIKKDRTFFFASYEGRRVVHGISSDPVVVPTAAERAGDFSASSFGGTLNSSTLASILNNRPGCAAAVAAQGGLPIAVSNPYGATLDASGNIVSPGIFTNMNTLTDSQIPSSCFDPVALDILNKYVPLPNSGTNIFRSIPNDNSHANQVTVKMDHKINEKQNLSVYYYFNDGFDAQPFTRFQASTPNLLQGFGNNNATRSQQVNISHTWSVNPTSVNELRLTYFREAQGTFIHPQHTNLVTNSCSAATAAFCFTGTTDVPGVIPPNPKLGITPNLGPNREGVPFISISGGFTIGNDFEGELPQIGNTYQASDNFTKVFGNHTTKFGVDFRNQRFLQTLFFDLNGDFTYSGGGPNDFKAQNLFPNYLMGIPDSYLQGSAQTEDVRGNSLYLFAQDSWKIRPNLTLNYGLRWEYNQPLYDAGKRYQTFRPGQATTTFPCQLNPMNPLAGPLVYGSTDCTPTGPAAAVFPLGLVVPGDKGVPKGLTDTYYRAFAPRIGIAWDPWKDGKTTIRAGFGIFYNPIEQLVLEQFQAEPPFGGSSLVSQDLFSTPFVLQSGSTVPNPFNGILNPKPGSAVDWSVFRPILLFGELEPKLRAQYTEQYNFGIQHEILKDMVMSIGYVGSQGHRLLATHDLNFGNAQTCLDLQRLFNSGNPAYTAAVNGWADTTCGPFFSDSSYGFVLQPGDTLTLPSGQVVTGAAGTGTPIGLVGLRRYSSPSCNPVNSWDPVAIRFINGCPADGVPVFSSIFAQDTVSNSNYNSLQASLEKRFTHGLQFQLSYTFSKSIDNASSFENLLKPLCDRCNRSLSLFDARHRFVISYLWDLPVPKYEGVKGTFLNGWAVSGITSFQTGFPIRIESIADQELENSFDFELPGKPDLVGPFVTYDPRKHNGHFFCDPSSSTPCSLQPAALGSLGSSPRTLCCGPGIDNFDFSVQKVTPVGEGKRIEFRAEFFNIFNHTQFLNPDGNISDGSDFGRVKRARDPRNIQFALKFAF